MACKYQDFLTRKNNHNSGFTLIELIVGILVLSIAIVMFISMLLPQGDKAVESLYRMRSAELAHSIMNEIWGKRFDENTNSNGGVPACNSPYGQPCSTLLGPDGESRDKFDDVDDYHGLSLGSFMLNSTQTYKDVYPNFGLSVTVEYLSVPPAATSQQAKLITINVTTPMNEVITYQAVRSNY